MLISRVVYCIFFGVLLLSSFESALATFTTPDSALYSNFAWATGRIAMCGDPFGASPTTFPTIPDNAPEQFNATEVFQNKATFNRLTWSYEVSQVNYLLEGEVVAVAFGAGCEVLNTVVSISPANLAYNRRTLYLSNNGGIALESPHHSVERRPFDTQEEEAIPEPSHFYDDQVVRILVHNTKFMGPSGILISSVTQVPDANSRQFSPANANYFTSSDEETPIMVEVVNCTFGSEQFIDLADRRRSLTEGYPTFTSGSSSWSLPSHALHQSRIQFSGLLPPGSQIIIQGNTFTALTQLVAPTIPSTLAGTNELYFTSNSYINLNNVDSVDGINFDFEEGTVLTMCLIRITDNKRDVLITSNVRTENGEVMSFVSFLEGLPMWDRSEVVIARNNYTAIQQNVSFDTSSMVFVGQSSSDTSRTSLSTFNGSVFALGWDPSREITDYDDFDGSVEIDETGTFQDVVQGTNIRLQRAALSVARQGKKSQLVACNALFGGGNGWEDGAAWDTANGPSQRRKKNISPVYAMQYQRRKQGAPDPLRTYILWLISNQQQNADNLTFINRSSVPMGVNPITGAGEYFQIVGQGSTATTNVPPIDDSDEVHALNTLLFNNVSSTSMRYVIATSPPQLLDNVTKYFERTSQFSTESIPWFDYDFEDSDPENEAMNHLTTNYMDGNVFMLSIFGSDQNSVEVSMLELDRSTRIEDGGNVVILGNTVLYDLKTQSGVDPKVVNGRSTYVNGVRPYYVVTDPDATSYRSPTTSPFIYQLPFSPSLFFLIGNRMTCKFNTSMTSYYGESGGRNELELIEMGDIYVDDGAKSTISFNDMCGVNIGIVSNQWLDILYGTVTSQRLPLLLHSNGTYELLRYTTTIEDEIEEEEAPPHDNLMESSCPAGTSKPLQSLSVDLLIDSIELQELLAMYPNALVAVPSSTDMDMVEVWDTTPKNTSNTPTLEAIVNVSTLYTGEFWIDSEASLTANPPESFTSNIGPQYDVNAVVGDADKCQIEGLDSENYLASLPRLGELLSAPLPSGFPMGSTDIYNSTTSIFSFDAKIVQFCWFNSNNTAEAGYTRLFCFQQMRFYLEQGLFKSNATGSFELAANMTPMLIQSGYNASEIVAYYELIDTVLEILDTSLLIDQPTSAGIHPIQMYMSTGRQVRLADGSLHPSHNTDTIAEDNTTTSPPPTLSYFGGFSMVGNGIHMPITDILNNINTYVQGGSVSNSGNARPIVRRNPACPLQYPLDYGFEVLHPSPPMETTTSTTEPTTEPTTFPPTTTSQQPLTFDTLSIEGPFTNRTVILVRRHNESYAAAWRAPPSASPVILVSNTLRICAAYPNSMSLALNEISMSSSNNHGNSSMPVLWLVGNTVSVQTAPFNSTTQFGRKYSSMNVKLVGIDSYTSETEAQISVIMMGNTLVYEGIAPYPNPLISEVKMVSASWNRPPLIFGCCNDVVVARHATLADNISSITRDIADEAPIVFRLDDILANVQLPAYLNTGNSTAYAPLTNRAPCTKGGSATMPRYSSQVPPRWASILDQYPTTVNINNSSLDLVMPMDGNGLPMDLTPLSDISSGLSIIRRCGVWCESLDDTPTSTTSLTSTLTLPLSPTQSLSDTSRTTLSQAHTNTPRLTTTPTTPSTRSHVETQSRSSSVTQCAIDALLQSSVGGLCDVLTFGGIYTKAEDGDESPSVTSILTTQQTTPSSLDVPTTTVQSQCSDKWTAGVSTATSSLSRVPAGLQISIPYARWKRARTVTFHLGILNDVRLLLAQPITPLSSSTTQPHLALNVAATTQVAFNSSSPIVISSVPIAGLEVRLYPSLRYNATQRGGRRTLIGSLRFDASATQSRTGHLVQSSIPTSAFDCPVNSSRLIDTTTHYIPFTSGSSIGLTLTLEAPPPLLEPAARQAVESVAVAASVGAGPIASDLQVSAALTMLACSPAGKTDSGIRALSPIALANTCEGLILSNAVALCIVLILCLVGASFHNKFVNRKKKGSEPRVAFVVSAGTLRWPSLAFSAAATLQGGMVICGVRLLVGDEDNGTDPVKGVHDVVSDYAYSGFTDVIQSRVESASFALGVFGIVFSLGLPLLVFILARYVVTRRCLIVLSSRWWLCTNPTATKSSTYDMNQVHIAKTAPLIIDRGDTASGDTAATAHTSEEMLIADAADKSFSTQLCRILLPIAELDAGIPISKMFAGVVGSVRRPNNLWTTLPFVIPLLMGVLALGKGPNCVLVYVLVAVVYVVIALIYLLFRPHRVVISNIFSTIALLLNGALIACAAAISYDPGFPVAAKGATIVSMIQVGLTVIRITHFIAIGPVRGLLKMATKVSATPVLSTPFFWEHNALCTEFIQKHISAKALKRAKTTGARSTNQHGVTIGALLGDGDDDQDHLDDDGGDGDMEMTSQYNAQRTDFIPAPVQRSYRSVRPGDIVLDDDLNEDEEDETSYWKAGYSSPLAARQLRGILDREAELSVSNHNPHREQNCNTPTVTHNSDKTEPVFWGGSATRELQWQRDQLSKLRSPQALSLPQPAPTSSYGVSDTARTQWNFARCDPPLPPVDSPTTWTQQYDPRMVTAPPTDTLTEADENLLDELLGIRGVVVHTATSSTIP